MYFFTRPIIADRSLCRCVLPEQSPPAPISATPCVRDFWSNKDAQQLETSAPRELLTWLSGNAKCSTFNFPLDLRAGRRENSAARSPDYPPHCYRSSPMVAALTSRTVV